MLVGFNYPWPANRYITIGPNLAPRGAPQQWRSDGTIARNLDRLRAAGVSVVRIWLMADGLNYDGLVHVGHSAAQGPFRHFVPPDRLHPLFEEDFAALLAIFRKAGMRMIPVLLDFHFFDEPRPKVLQTHHHLFKTDGDYGRGRRSVATMPQYRDTFVTGTLEPLLDIAKAHADVVHAFEFVNEPHWCVTRLSGDLFGQPVDTVAMVDFLTACITSAQARGVPTTIGHRFAGDLTGTFAKAVVTHPQYHFYASLRPDDILDFSPVGGQVPIIGELGSTTVADVASLRQRASGRDVDSLAGTARPWPYVRGLDTKPDSVLPVRLQHAARFGCPLAVVWPDHVPPDPTRDDLKLSDAKLASITGRVF